MKVKYNFRDGSTIECAYENETIRIDEVAFRTVANESGEKERVIAIDLETGLTTNKHINENSKVKPSLTQVNKLRKEEGLQPIKQLKSTTFGISQEKWIEAKKQAIKELEKDLKRLTTILEDEENLLKKAVAKGKSLGFSEAKIESDTASRKLDIKRIKDNITTDKNDIKRIEKDINNGTKPLSYNSLLSREIPEKNPALGEILDKKFGSWQAMYDGKKLYIIDGKNQLNTMDNDGNVIKTPFAYKEAGNEKIVMKSMSSNKIVFQVTKEGEKKYIDNNGSFEKTKRTKNIVVDKEGKVIQESNWGEPTVVQYIS